MVAEDLTLLVLSHLISYITVTPIFSSRTVRKCTSAV